MRTELAALAASIERQWSRYGRETPIEGLFLTHAESPSGVIRSVYRPSFCVVVQGAKATMLGDAQYFYAAGQCLLASVDLPVTARITEANASRPYLAMSLAIDPAVVAELVNGHAQRLRDESNAPAIATSDLDQDLCDPLRRLLDLSDSPHDMAVIAPLIRREIVWRLLRGTLGPMLRQIGLADGRTARIGRATAWLREHYAETTAWRTSPRSPI
ncbi:AraC family transcriptional regulator [Pelagerythrobacter rhizovicinus]|uniref:AraC family transcriptional regulator n=1 Tax=Pelagerythrobacter rhizovicinus TaxID=2268576 RepID=UPI001CDB6C2B|nr:AraC family transcriptional regulator [Pelagerythrobacter rhizovicinus]